MKQPEVAVLGLGAMGHAFAANLLKKGFRVHGWNRTRARGEDLLDAGLQLADSPAEAVREADVVIAMLSDGDTTEQVLHQVKEAFKQGATLCQMGTIGVEKTDALIAFFAEKRPDLLLIDAPVSGTKAPAENAQILVLASGDQSRAQAAEAVFAAISKGTKWLGEAGKSTRMKLVINSWLIGMMQSLAESTRLFHRRSLAGAGGRSAGCTVCKNEARDDRQRRLHAADASGLGAERCPPGAGCRRDAAASAGEYCTALAAGGGGRTR